MEKNSQICFHNLLIKNDFHKEYIYYTPRSNELLKKVFKYCSKKGKCYGIPDCIYMEDKVIIVFECKATDLKKAEEDVFLYKTKMDFSPIQEYQIYFVAFVDDTNYKIFDNEKNQIQKKLFKQLFLVNKTTRPSTMKDLNKKIHDIHNYIRDYTKISDEDKPFFIAIILISIQKDSFQNLWNLQKDKLYIYDLLVENLKDYDIDISIFEFMRKDNNNIHFTSIIEKVLEIYNNFNSQYDLLNVFYNEFVKYKNSDGKSLGIVLTPDDIVDIMVQLAEIQKEDVILDLCSGTGSFLWKTLQYYPKKIIGCEYQSKLYSLLKCNNILQNKENKVKSEFYKDNCFLYDFTCSKSIINPPFSQKEKELDFVLKQLESLEDGGIAVSIFPISKITSPSVLRDDILKSAQIKTIVILNEKVFYNSHAGVKCIILVLEKNKKGHCDKTKIIDFSEDGFEMKRTYGRFKKENYDLYLKKFYYNLNVNQNNFYNIEKHTKNWLSEYYRNIQNEIYEKDLQIRILEEQLFLEKKKLMENSKLSNFPYIKNFKISDLFNILKKPNKLYTGDDLYIFEISARKYDNGINDIVSVNSIDKTKIFSGKKIVLVTGGDGGAGLAYYQQEPFFISSSTIVLEPKEIDLTSKIGHYIALELSKYKKIYDRGYGWTIERIKNDIICLPFCSETNSISI